MALDQRPNEANESLRYEIRLMVKHPSIDPASITDMLGLKPNVSGVAGSRRTTPAGKALPGVHEVSAWSHWFSVERNRRFFMDVVKVIDRLEPHKDFLLKIVNDGGTIDLIVQLPGDVNIGDSLPWREIARLCALRINLGVEVFPDFN
jgi:hypothetical protein